MATISIKQLEAFVAVADLGTFRRAAERLNTTQPNISNRIAQLEGQVRVTLMERDAGSVRLTPRGRDLLDRARAVLAEVDAFVAAADDTALFEGVLRLGVSDLVAHTWLHAFLREMAARYPVVDVELTVDLSATLSKMLFDRDLDLTFQNGPFDRPATGTVLLGASPYAWVASGTLGLHGRPLAAGDMLAHRILTHLRATAPYRQLEAHFRPAPTRARLVPSSTIATCLQMAVDGLGIACLPEAMVAPSLAEGRLERLAYPWVPDDLRFAARHLQAPPSSILRGALEIAQRLSPAEDKVSAS